jgi:sortase A
VSLVDTPSAPFEATVKPSSPPPVHAKEKPVLEARRRVVAIAVGALVIAMVAGLVFLAFEGPVAQSWYSTRQHQLASRLAVLGVHHGAGAPVALLQIPRLGTNLVVAEGDTPQQLRSGPGHRVGSPMPGNIGNSVIVGHRSGWGGPFRSMGALKRGDLIVVQTAGADGLPRNAVFKVTATQRVGANDVAPFAGSTDRRLTIVTGTGGAYSDARLVVTAVSGPEGKLKAPGADLRASTSSGSSLWNADLLLAVIGLGGAVLLWFALRRRYHLAAVAAVVVPIALVGLLGLLLNLDASLPPLR